MALGSGAGGGMVMMYIVQQVDLPLGHHDE